VNPTLLFLIFSGGRKNLCIVHLTHIPVNKNYTNQTVQNTVSNNPKNRPSRYLDLMKVASKGRWLWMHNMQRTIISEAVDAVPGFF